MRRETACAERDGVGCAKGAAVRRTGLLAERARRQGAHLARCASAHLVGGRVTDEGVIFNLYARFSQNYRFHVTALSKALLAIINIRARRMSR